MSFSQAAPPATSRAASRDTLFQTWDAVRLARQLPWEQDQPETWRAEFSRAISRAAQLLEAHVTESGSVHPYQKVDGHATAAITEWDHVQLSDHIWLQDQFEHVLAELANLREPQLGDVVRLSEWLVLMEMRIAMHYNRLHAPGSAGHAPPSRERARAAAGGGGETVVVASRARLRVRG